MKKKSILFVCTGNIFRSVSAEYSLKKYLSDNKIKGWSVSSAGIIAKKVQLDKKILEVLENKGIKIINHKQKKLTKKMLNDYAIVIAMAQNHVDFIKSKLEHRSVLLFNELAANKKTSVLDVGDEIKDCLTNRKAVEMKIESTIEYIFSKIPPLFSNICKINNR